MAAAPYLQPSEYAAYGIPAGSDAQVNAACSLIDAHLGRPEGLLWSPDANGMPAYMTNKPPSMSYSVAGPIAPGSGVTIVVPYAQFGPQSIGEVVILDRANSGIVEACVVTAASGNTLTLAGVQFAHPGPVTVDFGLTILEEMKGRVSLSRSPVVNILCGFGRYGYNREMRRLSSGFDYFEALLVTNYGQNGVSGWNQLDTTAWDINYATGAVRMPPHILETVRVHYIAGWTQPNLPAAIKQAVANIANGYLATPELSGSIQTLKSGDATITRFKGGSLDGDTLGLLAPYRTVRI